jgi:phosphate transport system ATP-binding protein
VTVSYAGVPAVRDVGFPVPAGSVVALIGPSGSGKSSLIRCMNRMNDLVPSAHIDGTVLYRGANLYDARVDAVEVASASGWCSRSRTRSPNRSTTTSRSARGS